MRMIKRVVSRDLLSRRAINRVYISAAPEVFLKPLGNRSCGFDVFKNRLTAQGDADGVIRLRQAQLTAVGSL